MKPQEKLDQLNLLRRGLEKEKKKLNRKKDGLVLVQQEIEKSLRDIDNKLNTNWWDIHREEEKVRDLKRLEDRTRQVLKEELFSKSHYPWALKVGVAAYLEDFYLHLIRVRKCYEGNKSHVDQMAPIMYRQGEVVLLGVCLELFTVEVVGKGIANFPALEERFKIISNAVDLHQIWHLVSYWERESLSFSEAKVKEIFSEFLLPYRSEIPEAKKALNVMYNLLAKKNLWNEN